MNTIKSIFINSFDNLYIGKYKGEFMKKMIFILSVLLIVLFEFILIFI